MVMEQTLDKRRVVLIVLAFIVGGAVPIQLITLSFGYAQYFKKIAMGPKVIMTAHQFAQPYILFIYLPSAIILALIIWYCRRNYPDIFRRIVVGLVVGAVATIALDFFRQMGVINGWLPGDTPVMFGKMATGSNKFTEFYPIGVLIHFLNGANFGLFYVFIWGKRSTYGRAVFWAVFWLILVEIGMMILPPMGPMVGLFGSRFAWPQLFLLTLAAHISFGIVLGLLSQFLLKEEDKSGIIGFILGTITKSLVEHKQPA
jgi:hypothetical protein